VIPGSAADGIPLLIGAEGDTQALERLPLTPEGRGVYDEAWLQRLIHQNPACLPIAEIEPALDSFSSVCCEIPTQRGFIDNLLMTGRGDIAIVEAKLFRNPEARRQALAQALDYSTCLFSMGYAEFEKAALAGTYTPRPKPASLYEGLPEPDKLIEAAFVDAVSQNLRRGRVLILVVGDGIRSEAATMLDGLRAHIGFGFTLALVELALFRMPEPDQRLLVRPTTIAKTVITQRTIIETTAGGLVVGAREETLPVAKTISAETYWEALETKVPGAKKALERLSQDAEPLGVYPDFLRSLNLKWDRPGVRRSTWDTSINGPLSRLYGPMLRPWRLPASWHIPMCRISRRHGAVMCVRCQLAKLGPSIRMVGRCASLQFSIVLMIGWDRFSGSSPPWQSKMRAADQGRTSRPRY
jgi:hypothetical protein